MKALRGKEVQCLSVSLPGPLMLVGEQVRKRQTGRGERKRAWVLGRYGLDEEETGGVAAFNTGE